MDISPATGDEHRSLLAELAGLGLVAPGTLLRRYARCGKANCRCAADPPALHGPWWNWTRKVNGKTVGVRFTEEQARDYQPWFDNARRLREIAAQLEQLGLREIEGDPRSHRG